MKLCYVFVNVLFLIMDLTSSLKVNLAVEQKKKNITLVAPFAPKPFKNRTSRKASSLKNETIIDRFINALIEKPYEMNTKDKVSYSKDTEVVQTHLAFDVDINMAKKEIKGKVRVHYHCLKKTHAIILDVMQIKILKVLSSKGESLFFNTFHPVNIPKSVGDGLAILLEDECVKDSFVEVHFRSIPRAIGLHFSDPQVMKDKKYGFLCTHGEAIYSRSYFPSQDTPSLKVTSEAVIRIESPYTAMFSGVLISEKKIGGKKENKIRKVDNLSKTEIVEYKYRLDKPIPTYLITFAAGVLDKIKVKDSRCTVFYEKANQEIIPKIHKTFTHCEDYIKFYEKAFNLPFQFGEMVFLIMPNDYPYRGLENPYVTYIAEVVLTNDHSFDSTLAHEIAHFWSGDLVTNQNWESFWLNEGITTYTSRKAIKEINNKEQYYFELFKGLNGLSHAIKDLTGNSKLDKSLLSLSPKINEDPYATYSKVPYEKGSLFLYHIEKTIGEKKTYEFLGRYFQRFKFKSVKASDFRKVLEEFLDDKTKKIIDWNAWTKGQSETLPVNFLFKSKRVDRFKEILANISKEGLKVEEIKKTFRDLKIMEKDHLLHKLGDKSEKNELPKSVKENLGKVLEDKQLFSQHLTNIVHANLLKAKIEDNEQKREAILIKGIEGFNYFGASYLKKTFKLLKQLKKYKEKPLELTLLLKKYERFLNPLTYTRLLEKIKEK